MVFKQLNQDQRRPDQKLQLRLMDLHNCKSAVAISSGRHIKLGYLRAHQDWSEDSISNQAVSNQKALQRSPVVLQRPHKKPFSGFITLP